VGVGIEKKTQKSTKNRLFKLVINNSAEDCSISLKLSTVFDHVTHDVPQTIKVNGSKVKVTSWHNVPAAKNERRYKSETISLTEFKLGENYPRAERNTTLVQGH